MWNKIITSHQMTWCTTRTYSYDWQWMWIARCRNEILPSKLMWGVDSVSRSIILFAAIRWSLCLRSRCFTGFSSFRLPHGRVYRLAFRLIFSYIKCMHNQVVRSTGFLNTIALTSRWEALEDSPPFASLFFCSDWMSCARIKIQPAKSVNNWKNYYNRNYE